MNTKRNDAPQLQLRVVIDTTVLIAAQLNAEGRAAYLLKLARQRRFRWVTSPAIIREFAGKLRTKFSWDEKQIGQILRRTARAAEIAKVTISLTVVPDDPNDNHIIECAVDGKADMIVSADGDLLRMKDYQNIPILHPNDFLYMLGE